MESSFSQTTFSYPAIVVLSAKNSIRLKEVIERFLKEVEDGQLTEDELFNAAYTLQVGREPMEERLALTANSINELVKKLKDFLEGKEIITSCIIDNIKSSKEELTGCDYRKRNTGNN
jgi:acyl transferase domain-containing protein